jgi:hypothetical protein
LQRAPPLKTRLGKAPGLPISVAQMIVDGRVLGHQLDRALQKLRRLGEVAQAVISPTETVDDVAVVGPQLDRALDHLERVAEVLALVDPGISQIIQHQRLLRRQFQRVLQIGLGERPAARALERHAAVVIEAPRILIAGLLPRDGLVVSVGRLLVFLVAAQHVAQFHQRYDRGGALGRQRLQGRFSLVGLAELIERNRRPEACRPGQQRVRVDGAVELERVGGAALIVADLAGEKLRQGEIRLEVEGKARIDERRVHRLTLIEQARDIEQRLGGALLRRIDELCRHLAGGDAREPGTGGVGSVIVREEAGVERLGLIGEAVPLVEISGDLDHPERGLSFARKQRLIGLLRIIDLIAVVRDERGVELAQRLEPLQVAHLHQHLARLARVAERRVHPCVQKRHGKALRALVRQGLRPLHRRVEMAGLDVLDQKDGRGKAGIALEIDDALRQGHGLGHASFRNPQGECAPHQVEIVRIVRERLFHELGGARVIVDLLRVARGKIAAQGARQRGHGVGRRRDICRLRGRRGTGRNGQQCARCDPARRVKFPNPT